MHGNNSIYPFIDSTFVTPVVSYWEFLIHLVARPILQTFGADASISGLAFHYGNNVSDRTSIIADSLTNWIQASQGSVEVLGTNSVQVTVISIDWAWLTLPIILVFSSAIFLFITVMCSRKNSVPVWKSSLMPLLFHGLEGWTTDDQLRFYTWTRAEGYWKGKEDFTSTS
ncbi:hypothetical protein F5X97DRAFT_327466 [Nemania serpens]|nr:hypothetical protein F5X97DRAFT_327466 [Nemania serpens]